MKQKVDQPRKPLTRKKGKGRLKKKDVGSSCTWGKAEQERFKYEWKSRECPAHEIVSRDCLIAKQNSDNVFKESMTLVSK
jgi:hypothetical protein